MIFVKTSQNFIKSHLKICIIKEIKDEEDTMIFQRDVDRLGSWARKWGMRFQPVKYDAADKKTDQEDPCFINLRGN